MYPFFLSFTARWPYRGIYTSQKNFFICDWCTKLPIPLLYPIGKALVVKTSPDLFFVCTLLPGGDGAYSVPHVLAQFECP